MKRLSKTLFGVIVIILFVGTYNISRAEDGTPEPTPEPVTISLTIRDGELIIFENAINLQPAGTIELEDSSGNLHSLNSQSVLSVVNDADLSDHSWSISDLQYFDSFGAFYLKCIESSVGADCDNWQYAVDGLSPSSSMDQNVLSGGENVYVYFGPQSRVTLSSSSITESDILTVTAQNYDYENNDWEVRTNVTAGLTQPNSSDPFNPIEVATNPVDENGQATFSSIVAGSYNVGIKEDFYFPTEALEVTATLQPSSGGGGSSKTKKSGEVLGTSVKLKFDLKKAFDFLIAQQKENGSFGEDIYTDWTTIALASGNYQGNIIKLVKYFVEFKTENPILTDYERHAMALMALGLNPYNTNGENYIEKITAGFDGKQFGDINEDNEDIFALIVLQNAGFKVDEKMLIDDIAFILSKQKENGSWDESVDMTGAGIEALASISQDEKVKDALEKAKGFLKQNQKATGGWGNVSSTAWAIEGILALKENPEDWKKNDPAKDGASNTPFDYLVANQDTDGGIKGEDIKNRIWETAYVIKAHSDKTWNEIMQKFEKPKDTGRILGASDEIKMKEVPKKIIAKVKKDIPKVAPIENTATVTNSLEENNAPQSEPKKENWFIRFLKFIF